MQVLGQSVEILRDRRAIHDNNKFDWQASALDKLSICYTNLGDFDSALTCISQIEALEGFNAGAKVAYAKANCLIRKKDLDSALECLSQLSGFGESAFEYSRQVAFNVIVESNLMSK